VSFILRHALHRSSLAGHPDGDSSICTVRPKRRSMRPRRAASRTTARRPSADRSRIPGYTSSTGTSSRFRSVCRASCISAATAWREAI
jgi:hypothetical protein